MLYAHADAPAAERRWARGVENQRVPDLGNGTFLNPILSGDHADPSILKDGSDYYMTHSSFFTYPGLLIWHSKDLVNWEPVGPALKKNVGSVWAPDLVRHKGHYYIYFPGMKEGRASNFVVHAKDIHGPWSEPIDLNIVGRFDPGHVVDDAGKRYLFLDDGYMIALADDGLSAIGQPTKVYDGWQYPADWVVTAFGLEGPKLVKHGEYFYMLSAEGGTAGPPTSHMVVVARSKSIQGPWENSSDNPLVHTRSKEEKWWSKGHGSLVEGPNGKWYLVYHAYENGFWTLGRQTLLEPVEWTPDGWLKSAGLDVARPMPKPGNQRVPHGMALSDDFSRNKMGTQWGFHEGSETDTARVRYEKGALVLKAKGDSPRNSSPLTFTQGDLAYEVEVEVEIDEAARAGLLVFYNAKLYAGLGFDRNGLIMHRYGADRPQKDLGQPPRKLHLRLVNDRNIVTIFTSPDGKNWTRFRTIMEVSGYHHNVADGFVSLRPAIYVAGQGEARFKNFRYRALP